MRRFLSILPVLGCAACGSDDANVGARGSGASGGSASHDGSAGTSSTGGTGGVGGNSGVGGQGGGAGQAGSGAAGAPDAGLTDAGATFDLALHVVVGPKPTAPMAGARVRAESGGAFVEGQTDALGGVTLKLDAARVPWDVTVAKAGFAVISVVGVDTLGVSGDIRLDPFLNLSGWPTRHVQGQITGKQNPANLVQVAAWDLPPISATPDLSYDAQFLVVAAALPLRLVAIELDPSGLPVNCFVSQDYPRDSDVSGADIVFPDPPMTPNDVVVSVDFPGAGILTAAAAVPEGNTYVNKFTPLHEAAFMTVGGGRVQSSVSGFDWQVRSYGGGAMPDVAFTRFTANASFFDPGLTINVQAHAFQGTTSVTVGRVDALAATGMSLDDLTSSAQAEGWDALALHLGETPNTAPVWRIFAPFHGGTAAHIARIPHLPTGVSATDIGILPFGTTNALALLMRLDTAAPWSTRAANTSVPEYQATVAGAYMAIQGTGR